MGFATAPERKFILTWTFRAGKRPRWFRRLNAEAKGYFLADRGPGDFGYDHGGARYRYRQTGVAA